MPTPVSSYPPPSANDEEVVILEEIDDEAFTPTPDELEQYARMIGIDPATEPHLMSIALEGVQARLPDGWVPCETKKGAIFYLNTRTQETSWELPLDAKFVQLVHEARSKMQRHPRSLLTSTPGRRRVAIASNTTFDVQLADSYSEDTRALATPAKRSELLDAAQTRQNGEQLPSSAVKIRRRSKSKIPVRTSRGCSGTIEVSSVISGCTNGKQEEFSGASSDKENATEENHRRDFRRTPKTSSVQLSHSQKPKSLTNGKPSSMETQLTNGLCKQFEKFTFQEVTCQSESECQGRTNQSIQCQGRTDQPVECQGHIDQPIECQGCTDQPVEFQGRTDQLIECQGRSAQPMAIQQVQQTNGESLMEGILEKINNDSLKSKKGQPESPALPRYLPILDDNEEKERLRLELLKNSDRNLKALQSHLGREMTTHYVGFAQVRERRLGQLKKVLAAEEADINKAHKAMIDSLKKELEIKEKMLRLEQMDRLEKITADIHAQEERIRQESAEKLVDLRKQLSEEYEQEAHQIRSENESKLESERRAGEEALEQIREKTKLIERSEMSSFFINLERQKEAAKQQHESEVKELESSRSSRSRVVEFSMDNVDSNSSLLDQLRAEKERLDRRIKKLKLLYRDYRRRAIEIEKNILACEENEVTASYELTDTSPKVKYESTNHVSSTTKISLTNKRPARRSSSLPPETRSSIGCATSSKQHLLTSPRATSRVAGTTFTSSRDVSTEVVDSPQDVRRVSGASASSKSGELPAVGFSPLTSRTPRPMERHKYQDESVDEFLQRIHKKYYDISAPKNRVSDSASRNQACVLGTQWDSPGERSGDFDWTVPPRASSHLNSGYSPLTQRFGAFNLTPGRRSHTPS